MMAARFRSVAWVALAVVPALGCYLVTQYVASERAQLAKVERQIGQTRRAIRDLQTELGTRGSMAQIERWNTQTLALAAPTAQQFITGDVRLASLSALPALPRAVMQATVPAVVTPGTPTIPAPAEVRQASFQPAPAAPPAPASLPVRAKVEVREAAYEAPRRAAALPAPDPEPLLRQATYEKPARARPAPTKVAMLSGGLAGGMSGPLDAGTLADIGRIARSERGNRR